MAASDWVDLGSENIGFVATLDRASGISLFAKDPDSAKTNHEDEYLLTLEAQVGLESLPWMKKVKDEQVEFIIILDMSGSMSGTPWSQVQSAAIKILEMVKGNKKIFVKIMVYNENARFIQLNENSTVASMEIKQLRAGGSTNFDDVFKLLGKRMQERISAVEKQEKSRTAEERFRAGEKRKMFVIFMTDGHDTCNPSDVIMASKEQLQDIMKKYGEEVVVHVLGFSEYHNDTFLNDLSLMGTSDGSYSFVNPKDDGNKGLERTLTDLMKATTGLIGKSVYLLLKMKYEARFLGDWFGTLDKEIVLQAFINVDLEKNRASIVTTKFVRLQKYETLKMDIEMVRDLLEKTNTTAVCTLKNIQVNNDPSQRVALRKLRTGLNMLTARLGHSVDDSNTRLVAEECKIWHRLISKSVEESTTKKTPAKDEKEVRDLYDTIRNGLAICGRALERGTNESEEVFSKRTRAVHTTYNLSSGQMYNTKSSAARVGMARTDRSQMQQIQKMMD